MASDLHGAAEPDLLMKVSKRQAVIEFPYSIKSSPHFTAHEAGQGREGEREGLPLAQG